MIDSRYYFKLLLAISFLVPVHVYSNTFTLHRSIELALECSPALKEAEATVQMKLAECWQAGLWINPELSFEIDGLGGRGNRCGWDDHEATLALSQIVELGGKRSARQRVAAAEACIAIWEREKIRHELIQNVTNAYINIAAFRTRIKILEALKINEQEAFRCVKEKVKEGKSNIILQKQNHLGLTTTLMAHRKAIAELSAAERALTSYFGSCTVCLDVIDYPLDEVQPPMPLNLYCSLLDNNPEVSIARTNVHLAAQKYNLERANSVPDIELTAGVVRENDTRECSLLLGIEIILPIFDRNEGNICRSSWETWQASYHQEEIEQNLETKLANVHERLVTSFEIVEAIRNESLPAAQEFIKIFEEGREQGKFECLDVLTAKSKYYEIQLQNLDALTEYHHIKTELETLSPMENHVE